MKRYLGKTLRVCGVVAMVAVALPSSGFARPVAVDPGPETAVGRVEGNVRLVVAGEPAPPMLSPYARRRYRPPTPSKESPSSPENVVVYVLVNGGPTAPGGTTETILQRDQMILPHVTAVQTGTRVEFPNQDSVFHNLFSLGGPGPFNLGRYAPGTSRWTTFSKPGIVRMFCDIHSQMGGIVLVVDTPYFTQPDETGHFSIDGVPTGRHTLVAWHESIGTVTTEIVVTANGVARADFNLPG